MDFYSHEHQCSLATTFHSVPDPIFSQSNDTVLRTINLKLEASCTKSASKASSRLFLVDSTAAKGALKERRVATADVSYFRRAIHHLEARRSLGRFRRYYNHLQEEEAGTTTNDLAGESRSLDLSKLDILVCSLNVVVWLLNLLAHQRLPDKAADSLWTGFSGCCQHKSLFVFFHLCAYYVLGTKMLHSSRAAGLVGLYSLTEYVIQWV
jgi:hypothetical protein